MGEHGRLSRGLRAREALPRGCRAVLAGLLAQMHGHRVRAWLAGGTSLAVRVRCQDPNGMAAAHRRRLEAHTVCAYCARHPDPVPPGYAGGAPRRASKGVETA